MTEKFFTKRPWGAHMSIAGGVSRAAERGASVGANTLQIFTKNNNRWSGKPLTQEEIDLFLRNNEERGITIHASHDCYLINLASPDETLYQKSIAAFLDEMDRAEALGIPCLVFHPGAHVGSGDEAGIERVIKALNHCCKERPDSPVNLTIETTAGQGSSLGWRFEQIAAIIDGAHHPARIGVCVDTCHIFAAGYEINTTAGWKKTWGAFNKLIGVDKVKLFHVNDSKRELGSRVDRHDHIGKGHIGLDGFRNLVNDHRFKKTAMILETPKGKECREDAENLATLANLIA